MLAARTIGISLMVVALLLIGTARWAHAQNAPSNQELLDKMKAMEERIQTLERQLEQKNAPPAPAPVAAPTPPGPAASAGTPAAPGAPAAPGTTPAMAQTPPSGSTAPSKDIFGILPSPIQGLKLGAY
jgi:hypothetical protein